jgi:TonB family protein
MSLHSIAMVSSWQEWDGRIVNGKYPLSQYLGGSEQGAVYRTEFQGSRAAIKMMPSDGSGTSAQVAAWKLAARLSHPNLVRVLDTGVWHADDAQDMEFAVVEYCDESLAQVLRQRALTADEPRAMLLPTLDALQYLHAQGIVHGQTDPAHLRAAGDQLKLSTDGLRRNGEPGISRGSAYDPPEPNFGVASFSGDIWSLGITICEALTGRLPVRTKDSAPEWNDLAAPFDAIVRGCLAPDRERRLSISAIRNLLDKAPAADPISQIKLGGDGAKSDVQTNTPITIRKAAVEPAVAATLLGGTTSEPTRSWRTFVLPAAALLLILAILIGVRLSHTAPAKPASRSSAGSPRTEATPAAATTSASATANASTPTAVPGSVLHRVTPEISAKAKNTINGTVKVKVRVEVNRQGEVAQATLVAHGPSSYFATRAMEAAREWTFVAPVHDGTPQPSDWTLQFEFRKNGTRVSAQRTSRS